MSYMLAMHGNAHHMPAGNVHYLQAAVYVLLRAFIYTYSVCGKTLEVLKRVGFI